MSEPETETPERTAESSHRDGDPPADPEIASGFENRPRRLKVCVVIPTLNEEEDISDVVSEALPFADEVLVVDGHSTDRTREVAEAAGARFVLDPKQGKGAALRAALTATTADVVVYMDADGSHEAKDIPRLVAPIDEGRADLVVGCRMTGGSDELHGDLFKFTRLIGSEILTMMVNYRWKAGLTDIQNGFRAIRRDTGIALGMQENRFAIEEEMVMRALRKKYRVVNVSSHEYKRRHGVSRIVLQRDWFSFIWCVLKHITGLAK